MEEIMTQNTKVYEKPSIVFEGTLEVQAGSPVGDLNIGLNWDDL